MPNDKNYVGPRTRNLDVMNERRALIAETSNISWGAIFAGALVSLIVYAALMALGLAFGGENLQGVIQGENSASSLGFGAAIWTVIAVLASLYVGGHISGRVAGLIPVRVGRVQGMVVAALFFALMFSQAGKVIGSLGSGLGNTLGLVGTTIGDVASSSVGQDVIQDAIGDLDLKSPPETVVKGIASRLIRGDEQAALNYLSAQAGISQQEARTRIDSFRAQFQQAVTEAGVMAARSIRVAGWTLFGALLFGTLFAMIGGGVGARMNLKSPLTETDLNAIDQSKAA